MDRLRKKLPLILLLALLLLALLPVQMASAAGIPVKVTASDYTPDQWDRIDFTVTMESTAGQALAGVELTVDIPDGLFLVASSVQMSSGCIPATWTKDYDIITEGSGTKLMLHGMYFEFEDPLERGTYSGTGGQIATFTCIATKAGLVGSVPFSKAGLYPEPSTTNLAGTATGTEPINVTAKSVKFGDVNNDGDVNLQDVIILGRYNANWGVSLDMQAADVNLDGVVNLQDVIILGRKNANWSEYSILPYLP